MSTTTSISSSSDVTYATQLAQAANLKRSLYNIGNAIESGDLTSAGAKLTTLTKAYPQYATASGGTSTSSNPINNGFKAVSDAIANNDEEGAKAAWSQLKSDLADAGVKSLSDGSADTTKLIAENQASMNQSLLSAVFGSDSSSPSNMLGTLLGSATSSSGSDAVGSTISSWLTYQATGNSSPTTDTSGGILNTIA